MPDSSPLTEIKKHLISDYKDHGTSSKSDDAQDIAIRRADLVDVVQGHRNAYVHDVDQKDGVNVAKAG